MIKYCLVNRETRAVDYGIGTYSEFVLDFVKSVGRYEIVVLHLYRWIETPRMELIQDIMHIHIALKLDCFNSDVKAMFNKVFAGSEVIFHFNNLIVDEWGPFLKELYPSTKIVCTVHYLSWYYSLGGNKELFHKVIETEGLATLHPKSQYTYTYFRKNALSFQCCDYVIVLCNETYEMLRDIYGVDENLIYLIPNGIKPLEHPIKRRYDNSTTNIIYVGRIDEIKGIMYLAKAFSIIKKSYANANLHLIGDAENKSYLQQCLDICPDIKYHGRLSHKELDAYYCKSDIGVIPSFHEQCSYSLIEMMSYGLPVVGTNATGIDEMLSPVPNSKVPIELAFNDESEFVKEIAAAITRYICDLELRKKDSFLMSSLFHKKYTIDIFNKNMYNFLNNICR